MRRAIWPHARLSAAAVLALAPAGAAIFLGTTEWRVSAKQAIVAPRQPGAAAGTGAISGVVIDDVTGAPLGGAVVVLGPPNIGPSGESQNHLTDPKGRFVFYGLPAFDRYSLRASKHGYSTAHYGPPDAGPTGTPIALVEGQWFPNAHIRLQRPASLSGRVTDERGEPVVGVFVRAVGRMPVAGHFQLVAGPVTTTDDRGMYRIGKLSAGEYIVQVPTVQSSIPSVSGSSGSGAGASPGSRGFIVTPIENVYGRYPIALARADGKPMAYPPTFHPDGRAVAEAISVLLRLGEERTGIDVRLAPVATFRLGGVIVGAPDAVANLTVRLMAPGTEGLGVGGEVATALAQADGTFVFLNVPEGQYVLEARRAVAQLEFRPAGSDPARLPRPPGATSGTRSWQAPVPSAPDGTSMAMWTTDGNGNYWARQEVTVKGRDRLDLQLDLRRAAVLSGRFEWEDEAAPAASGFPAWVRLEPAAGDVSLGLLQSEPQQGSSRFHVEGLLPGEYVLKTLRTYRIKSITWNGEDYTHRPFDATAGQDFSDVRVTLTTRTTELTGSVKADATRPDDLRAVVVFPVEREQWTRYGLSPARIASASVTNVSRYRIPNLPAGTYYAVAVPAGEINAWKDPSFLERAASGATRVSIQWGEHKSLDLTSVRLDR